MRLCFSERIFTSNNSKEALIVIIPALIVIISRYYRQQSECFTSRRFQKPSCRRGQEIWPGKTIRLVSGVFSILMSCNNLWNMCLEAFSGLNHLINPDIWRLPMLTTMKKKENIHSLKMMRIGSFETLWFKQGPSKYFPKLLNSTFPNISE